MKKILLSAIIGLGLLAFSGCYANKSSCNAANSIKTTKCCDKSKCDKSNKCATKKITAKKCGASAKCGQGKCGSAK